MIEKLKIVIILFSSSILLINCTEDEPDLGKYYEDTYNDTIIAVMKMDSITIIIEQLATSGQVNEFIPYDTTNTPSLVDTILIELEVKFGSYSPKPDPYMDMVISNDTLTIWYASQPRAGIINLNKHNTTQNISGIQTSPKQNYYSIENIIIQKSPQKRIQFESKLYQ